MATPQQLADAAVPYDSIPNQGAAIIYLLAEISGMSDVQTIINNSACYQCIPAGLQGAIQIYLLDQIAAGGGGGIGDIVALTGSNAPAAAPSSGRGIAYNEVPNLWIWNTTSLAWDQIV